MTMFQAITRAARRLLFLSRRPRLERELAEEMALHLHLKQQAAGRDAAREMGNMTLAKEQSRDVWGFAAAERWLQDIRFAVRTFGRNPAFSLIVIASLALGIAGNTAIFSILDSLLIRPLPYPHPENLVRITGLYPKAILHFFEERSRTLDIAYVSPGAEFNVTGMGPAFRVLGSETSANFFAVMGVTPSRGRTFVATEDRPGNDGVVVLSHAFWRSHFGSDGSVIGRSFALGGVNRRIAGIAPAGFAYPSAKVQFWIPAPMDPTHPEQYWGGEFAPLIGRLRPGATLQQAQREIHSLAAGVWTLFPWPMPRRWNADSTVISLQTDLAGESTTKMFLLFGAVGTVLIIACANAASLLLARATARRKEMALRAALGAGTRRIVRQLLTESMVLALTAGALGMVLGSASVSLFQSLAPAGLLSGRPLFPDWRVCLFTAALSVLTGVAFGLVPALSSRQLDLAGAVKTGSQRSATKGWLTLRSWLIAGEIALTVVLVVGAGLLTSSLARLLSVNPGFNAQQILIVKISPNESFCTKRQACVAYYNRVLAQTRAADGVRDAALVNTVPLDGELPVMAADLEDHPRTPDFPSPMFWNGAVSLGYFHLMQIPLLSGRVFSPMDGLDSTLVVIIPDSTAKHFWPGQNPIGKHIRRAGERTWRTVVGVVGDVRQFNLADRSPGAISGALYLPYAQAVTDNGQMPVVMNLLVKSVKEQALATGAIRRIIADANPDVPVGSIYRLAEMVGDSMAGFRSILRMFLTFAAAALALAAIGLYGLMSYSVSQRTYEISVRMAIGAKAREVAGLILQQSLRITMAGTVCGILIAALATRLLSSLLFGVTSTDPIIFGAVALLVITVAAGASALPAWRAARIDPVKALRSE